MLPLDLVTRVPQYTRMLADSTRTRADVRKSQESYNHPLLQNLLMNMFLKLVPYLGLGSFDLEVTLIQT
jgi:hypothetical protein